MGVDRASKWPERIWARAGQTVYPMLMPALTRDRLQPLRDALFQRASAIMHAINMMHLDKCLELTEVTMSLEMGFKLGTKESCLYPPPRTIDLNLPRARRICSHESSVSSRSIASLRAFISRWSCCSVSHWSRLCQQHSKTASKPLTGILSGMAGGIPGFTINRVIRILYSGTVNEDRRREGQNTFRLRP